MTQHGIYGTLVSLDEEKNEAVIETTPGTKLRVHRQTLARVIEPNEVVTDEQELEAEVDAVEPEFGERTDDVKPKRSPRKKPTE
jgi:preprotein translocase subunit YajC